MVRRYEAQREARAGQLQAKKEAAEAERDAIFNKLALEEAQRRAEADYLENLRTELQVQELEENARAREEAER